MKFKRTIWLKWFGVVALVSLALCWTPEAWAEPPHNPTQNLFKAAKTGDIHQAKVAVNAGADVYALNNKGQSAIDVAVELANFAVVQYLFKVRDERDTKGQSKPVMKRNPHELVELPRPPDYPPSTHRPAAPVKAKPVEVALPKPQPKLQKIKPQAQELPASPVFKPIEVIPMPGLSFPLTAVPKTEPIKPLSMTLPVKTLVKKVPQVKVQVITPPAAKVEAASVAKVVAPPLPIVDFTPKTKSNMSPIRTFFLKAMPPQTAAVPTASDRVLKSKPKAKVEKPPQIPWGSVKPAGSVIDAPDFPTVPKRLTKSGAPVACDQKSTDKLLDKTKDKNMSSSIILDLPSVTENGEAGCPP